MERHSGEIDLEIKKLESDRQRTSTELRNPTSTLPKEKARSRLRWLDQTIDELRSQYQKAYAREVKEQKQHESFRADVLAEAIEKIARQHGALATVMSQVEVEVRKIRLHLEYTLK